MTNISPPTAPATTSSWVRVCALDDLEVERGRAALLGSTQIALVRLIDGTVRAVSNYDPYGQANVLSRGIVGSKSLADGSEAPTIASPLHKQAWDLRTGAVVETQGKDEISIPVFPVAVDDGQVLVRWQEA
ncbi:nitrite reductase small subunit NirD [Microbacterium amylolyticum]|uniref:Nitrite reductase (NADH) small subunit n=1 Tax=Microbacterium amylolyticum TaxID=936337 RepID=A0ABS4ZER5_9MICO|nr:nitrite reductase small subunit NirD [Microbacterium amylolyticum]MBP2435775.1 nitrite reductase (NADH) small subunit [Microbacterium amylolyticum]